MYLEFFWKHGSWFFISLFSFLKVKSSEEGTIHKKTKRITSMEWTAGNGIKDKPRKLIYIANKNTSWWTMIICDKAKGSFWEMALILVFILITNGAVLGPWSKLTSNFRVVEPKFLAGKFNRFFLVVVVKPLKVRVAFLVFVQIYQPSSIIKRYFILLRTLEVNFERSSTFTSCFGLISWIYISS